MPRQMFADLLVLIARVRTRPALAWAAERSCGAVREERAMPTRYVLDTNIAETIYGTDDHDSSLAYDEIFYGNGGADVIYAGEG